MRNIARTTLLLAALVSSAAQAQMDVDQADSLNFEAFHTDKKEAKKVWKEKDETVKTYEQPAATTTSVAPTATTTATTATPATTAAAATAPAAAATAVKPGQRFEIRERYTLGRSTSTPYSAFYVIEALHKQSAQLCPKGWKKLNERSEPVEQDFFLYYEIECL